MSVRLPLSVVICLILVVALGCVTQERNEVIAARKAQSACVKERSPNHSECLALQERSLTAEQRYENNAQRAWGCDPAQSACPAPR